MLNQQGANKVSILSMVLIWRRRCDRRTIRRRRGIQACVRVGNLLLYLLEVRINISEKMYGWYLRVQIKYRSVVVVISNISANGRPLTFEYFLKNIRCVRYLQYYIFIKYMYKYNIIILNTEYNLISLIFVQYLINKYESCKLVVGWWCVVENGDVATPHTHNGVLTRRYYIGTTVHCFNYIFFN